MSSGNITQDGLVRKTVLAEGSGEPPPLHARCLVHYVSRLADTQQVLVDTRDEGGDDPVPLVAGRDSLLREVGLHLAIATMRCGERCRLQVAPQYAFGERGSFSFPSVPPNADVEYEVELFDFEDVAEDRPRSSLTYEERLEAAARRRLEGNDHFRAARFGDALARYQLALSYVDEELLMQLDGPHAEQATAARSSLLLNAAACQLQLDDWHGAIAHCHEVLASDPKDVKALFRRGKAQLRLGNTDGAAADLDAAHRLAPDDAGIARELKVLRRQLRQERAAESDLFRGRLPPAPTPSSASSGSAPSVPAGSQPAGPSTAGEAAQQGPSWLVTGLVDLIRALRRIVEWFLPSLVRTQPS